MYDDRYEAQTHVASHAGSSSPRYYSFNGGLTHWVMLDTNPWVNALHGQMDKEKGLMRIEYLWLKEDLSKVNRTETPWVIVLGHHHLIQA